MNVMHRAESRVVVLFLAVASFAAAESDVRLVDAAKRQDKAAIRALLKQKAEVNAPLPDGATALHWAAYWDDVETVELLLQAGANVSSVNDLGVTPLGLACENGGSAALVGRLLKAGADPNAMLSTGETPLMAAARAGNAPAVKQLVIHGANVNARESTRGQTALMWAAAQRHAEVVQILTEVGADVHARSDTWLQLINSAGNHRKEGDYEIEQGGFTPLLFAARLGDIDTAKILLAAGARIDDPAASGATPLIIAAHSGHRSFAEWLLDMGADPNKTGVKYTALHAAVLRGDRDLVKALLAHQANPNARVERGTQTRRHSEDFTLHHDVVGGTAFWLAARYLDLELARILAAAGADVSLTQDGTTSLMAALFLDPIRQPESDIVALYRDGSDDKRLSLEMVKLAINLGVDVNGADDETGNAALHMAAMKGLHDVIRVLVNNGAKLDAKNKEGRTPLGMTLGWTERDLFGNVRNFGGASLKTTTELLRELGGS